MSGDNQPTTEDFLNFAGGVDASALSKNPAPAIAAPAEVPTESQSAIKRRLEDSIEGFLESDVAASQGGGDFTLSAPNMQFSDTVNQAIAGGGLQEESMNYNQAKASSPIDRFKAFIAMEKKLNPRFDVSTDLDQMIDYLIEQENLEAKFAKFNSPTVQANEETYNG